MPEKRRILVVDDNINFLQLAEIVLGDEFDIVKAHDGKEGLEQARADQPDLILLDVMMPRVSGLEMLRELQSQENTRKIPVLVITGSHFDPTTKELFQREPNVRAFLQKPCKAQTLQAEVKGALSGTR